MIDDLNQFGVGAKFDDPFLLYSSQSMPRDLVTALDWCRFLYFLNPQYRQATSRVCRHFITDFDYPDDGDQKERDALDDILHYKLKLPLFFAEVGDEWGCYGNAFIRMHFPFDRFLIDPKSGKMHSLDRFPPQQVKFDLNTMTYEVPDPSDPKGRKRTKMAFRDQKSTNVDNIKMVLLDPNFITIQHNKISRKSEFIWRFDPQIVADVKRGKLFMVNGLPQSMLQAIKNKEDFLFNDDQIFHFRAPVISGVSNNGWGIPGTLANYRSLHQLQVYRKIDEAIGLDYMVPFRMFTPAFGDKLNDVFNNLLMGQWTGSIAEIIANRRKDKFAIHALPFPVKYDEFAGDGKELTDKDLLEFQVNSMLDGMGYPVELFKCSLEYLQVPTAMRLFENSFNFIHVGYSDMTRWAVRRLRAYLKLPKIEVTLQKPSLADSLEQKQVMLQLASSGEVSRETAYDMFGIDNPINEIKKRMQEDIGIQKEKLKLDKDFQREQESGTLGQGDGQSGQNQQGGGGFTPTDIQGQAQELAQYWLQIPSDGERSKAMQSVRQSNPQLYALAKQMMEEQRRQGASQGRQQVNQQGQQQGGQGQSPGGPDGGQGGQQ